MRRQPERLDTRDQFYQRRIERIPLDAAEEHPPRRSAVYEELQGRLHRPTRRQDRQRPLDVHDLGSGTTPPKQPQTPARYRSKANAALALKDTWERSLYPCTAAAAALPLFGLGPIGQAVAGVIVPIGGGLCAVYVNTMANEEKTINDPPLRSFRETAKVLAPRGAIPKLPSCSKWRGAARALCQKLEPRVLALLGAARNTDRLPPRSRRRSVARPARCRRGTPPRSSSRTGRSRR